MSDVYLFPSAPNPTDVILRPIPPPPPIPVSKEYNLQVRITYIDMFGKIIRNGEIVDGFTSYTPFKPERGIQT